MTYSFSICNGYVVIDIDGNKFMLDTGLPTSMSVRAGLKEVTINGARCPLMSAGQHAPALSVATGIALDGLIGMDILSRLGGVTCDIAAGKATFGACTRTDGVAVPFERRNDFHFAVRANGKNARGYLDVGAPRTMVDDHSLLDESRCIGSTVEPSFRGPIRTLEYEGELEFGGVSATVRMLRSVPGTNRDGSQIYFSIASVAKEFFAIDLVNQTIRFL